ncbi:hypothetical protein KFU94_09230 [Chloroflexi bacterium TSY]|nr:hypothetical protein [Chloroflexi bacterium TSY]
MIITPEHVQQFHEEGYCILENVIPSHLLENLRSECSRFIDMKHVEMDREGTDSLGLNHRNKRYFIGLQHQESEKVSAFLFIDVMATECHFAQSS